MAGLSPKDQHALAEALQAARSGNTGVQLEILERLSKAHPRNATLSGHLGAALRSAGRFDDARTVLLRALGHDKRDPWLHVELALVYKAEARLAEAHRSLDSASALRPDWPTLRCLRADLHVLGGNHQQAWTELRPLVEQPDGDALVAMTFAKMSKRLGRQREAVTLLERLLADDRLPRVALADTYYRLAECSTMSATSIARSKPARRAPACGPGRSFRQLA